VSVSRNKPLPPPRFGMTRKNLTCGPTLTAKPNSGYSCLPAREHNRVLSEAWCLKLCPCTVMLSQLACHYSTHSLQPEECCQLRWDVSIRLFSCIKNTRKTENLYARYKKTTTQIRILRKTIRAASGLELILDNVNKIFMML